MFKRVEGREGNTGDKGRGKDSSFTDRVGDRESGRYETNVRESKAERQDRTMEDRSAEEQRPRGAIFLPAYPIAHELGGEKGVRISQKDTGS